MHATGDVLDVLDRNESSDSLADIDSFVIREPRVAVGYPVRPVARRAGEKPGRKVCSCVLRPDVFKPLGVAICAAARMCSDVSTWPEVRLRSFRWALVIGVDASIGSGRDWAELFGPDRVPGENESSAVRISLDITDDDVGELAPVDVLLLCQLPVLLELLPLL